MAQRALIEESVLKWYNITKPYALRFTIDHQTIKIGDIMEGIARYDGKLTRTFQNPGDASRWSCKIGETSVFVVIDECDGGTRIEFPRSFTRTDDGEIKRLNGYTINKLWVILRIVGALTRIVPDGDLSENLHQDMHAAKLLTAAAMLTYAHSVPNAEILRIAAPTVTWDDMHATAKTFEFEQ